MEKESAEKATTESAESVTNKEQGSLVETNEVNGIDKVINKPDSVTDVNKDSPLSAESVTSEKKTDDPAPVADNESVTPIEDDQKAEEELVNPPSEEILADEKVEKRTDQIDSVDHEDKEPQDMAEAQIDETSSSVEGEKEEVEVAPELPESELAEEAKNATEEQATIITPPDSVQAKTETQSDEIVPSAAEVKEEEVEVAPDEPKSDSTGEAQKVNEEETPVIISTDSTQVSESESEDEDTPKSDNSTESPKEDKKADSKPPVQDEFNSIDFTTLSKEELVDVIKKLGKDENPFNADRILQKIAPLFNEIRSNEKKSALEKHLAGGGTSEDFEYDPDELSLRFDANYKLIKDKKSKKFKEKDKQRVSNLALAEEVLNELRDFVDSEESSNSFTQFKNLQQKWRDIGDVPSQASKTLWANYNALVHRFYDQRSIYFELKELDRKKNYEAKLILCDKVEALEKAKNLREAIGTLNDLHHEFKHLGPVPQELQEDLWQRFKGASDKIYERRKLFVNELKVELHENLGKKQELIIKIKELLEFNSDRIKEWNEKTKELNELQKEWEGIGGLPKEKAKQINKEFWSSFKLFFKNKHQFFKKLDGEREESLIKKQALLEKAGTLKDGDDWEKTANEFKNLQSQWREIGPVPEKMRKKIYEEFKACCDHFFNNRRDGQKSSLEDFKTNLRAKKSIIGKINELKKDADKNLDEFNKLRKEFSTHGFVPKKNIGSIKDEFKNSVEEFLSSITVLNIKEKTEISLEAEFAGLAGSDHSDQDLYHKEQAVRRQINKLEDEIALWDNNLEFFAHSKSKSTDKLREDVNNKIDTASVQVESLKRQLKMIRTL